MSQHVAAPVQAQQKTTSTYWPTSGLLQRKCACGQHTIAGGECEECRQKREGMVQRAAANAARLRGVPPIVHDVLNSPGQPLDAGTRAFIEPRFGHDFSKVRVHTGSRAAESARAVNALAYTVGSDVVFDTGRYKAGTLQGKWLLAHELSHVAQAQMGGISTNIAGIEQEASRAATSVLKGEPVRLNQNHNGQHLYRFGEPENVPQLTYIAGPQRDGFIQSATRYHEHWGLAPHHVSSMEDIIDHLNSRAGALNRIRIVTHADHDNLYMGLFRNGSPGILQEELEAFGQSEASGLAQLFNQPLVSGDTPDLVLTELRNSNPDVLKPFGLDVAGRPGRAVASLIQRSAELLMLRRGTGGKRAQIRVMVTALNIILDDLRVQVQEPPPTGAGVTEAQALALQNAILHIDTLRFKRPIEDPQFIKNIRAAETAITHHFGTRLNEVRNHFTNSSWIDIRGCRVGGNLDYLRAVSHFFGTADQSPHVSGPEWFQSFPTLGFRTLTEKEIDSIATDSDVQVAIDHWAVITGLRQQIQLLRSILEFIITAPDGAQKFQILSQLLLPLLGGLVPLDINLLLSLVLANEKLKEPTLQRQVTQPGFGIQRPTQLTQPGFGLPGLSNPLIQFAQNMLATLNEPDAELKIYLHGALVLPVQKSTDADDIRLYMMDSLRRRAIDNWLNSQWAPAAPGLRNMKARTWSDGASRQVSALRKLHEDRNNPEQETVFSPDTSYWDHIKSV